MGRDGGRDGREGREGHIREGHIREGYTCYRVLYLEGFGYLRNDTNTSIVYARMGG